MASKRRKRQRQCSQKRRYATRAAAVQAIINMKRHGICRPETMSYPCKWCNGWHVGRPPRHLNKRRSVKIWEIVGR